MYLEDLTPEMQKIVLQGNSIYLMEQGFKDYLKSYNINIEDFKKKGRADKADTLVKWMNKECLDFSRLNIR